MSSANRSAPVSFRDPAYDDYDRRVETQLKLPSGLLSRIRTRGERSNADQVSSAGARTVYQITPSTRSLVLKKYGVDAYAGPGQAALAAGYLLREGLDRNGGSIAAAAAEYHGGTDRRQHGPQTRAYIARVTGRQAEAQPQSTYDRVKARRAAQQEESAGPSIAKIYDAYQKGQMTPTQAAQFEHDVNEGYILLPPGAKLRRAPAAPTLPAGVVRAYNDMNSGMTIEQRQQVDKDLQDGTVALPRGAKLNKWRPMTTGEEMKRGLGLGTRAVIEGVGDVAGLVVNPVNTMLNATGIPQKLLGEPLSMANEGALSIPDALGLPKPQFAGEKMLNAIERGATGGLVTYGLGTAGSSLPGMTGYVARNLAAAPVVDTVSGATGAASAETARQAGVGPAGQMVAGLAGGGLGIAGVSGTQRVVGRSGRTPQQIAHSAPREVLVDRAGQLTEDGQELIAREGISPDDLKSGFEPANDRAAPPMPEAPISAAGADAMPQQFVRRHEGIDHPVELLGNEQVDGTGRVHVQVRGIETGAVGFVPKDEVFPAPSARELTDTTSPASMRVSVDEPPPPGAMGAAQRLDEAQQLGIPLTRGQATQDFAIQDAEQTLRAQASGEGEKARAFLADQAEKIQDAANRFREAFGPIDATRAERGQIVKDALRDLRDAGKQGISALYREAQEMGGDGLVLKTAPIVEAAKRVLVEADVPDGVKNVVRQELARYGMIGKNPTVAEDGLTSVTLADGRKVQFYGEPKSLTVANAEEFRKAITAQYLSDGPRKLSQQIKIALDDTVEEAIENAAAGGVDGPVGAKLREARQAVVEHKQTFQAKDVVQRILDWKTGTRTDLILPENAIRDLFAGEASNLRRVKAILLSKPTPKSRAAWRAIQAEGVGSIFDRAYTANANLGGGNLGSISGAKLNSAAARFGLAKLKVLLDAEDLSRFMMIRRVVGNATIPVQGTTNPSGSAYKLMRFFAPFASKLSGIPMIGQASDLVSGVVKQARETAQAQATSEGMTSYSREQAATDAAGAPGRPRVVERADEAANAFIQALTDVARSGRLVPAVLSSTTDREDEPDWSGAR